MTTAKDYAIEHAKKAHGFVTMMLKDVPAEKLAAQLPGASNHFLWTLGHLASTYAFFCAAIGAKAHGLPESYGKLFAFGSSPTADAGAYPALGELLENVEKGFAAFVGHAEKLGEEELGEKALAGEGFLTTKMDGILSLAWHDGWHAGQLAALRRGLGMGAVL